MVVGFGGLPCARVFVLAVGVGVDVHGSVHEGQQAAHGVIYGHAGVRACRGHFQNEIVGGCVGSGDCRAFDHVDAVFALHVHGDGAISGEGKAGIAASRTTGFVRGDGSVSGHERFDVGPRRFAAGVGGHHFVAVDGVVADHVATVVDRVFLVRFVFQIAGKVVDEGVALVDFDVVRHFPMQFGADLITVVDLHAGNVRLPRLASVGTDFEGGVVLVNPTEIADIVFLSIRALRRCDHTCEDHRNDCHQRGNRCHSMPLTYGFMHACHSSPWSQCNLVGFTRKPAISLDPTRPPHTDNETL